MAYDQRSQWFGIRRQIIFLFLLLALFVIIPTVSFVRWWSVIFREQISEQLLTEGHNDLLFHVDEKRGTLEALALSFSRVSGSTAQDLMVFKRDFRLDLFSLVDEKGRVIDGDRDLEFFEPSRLAARQLGWPAPTTSLVSGFFYDASGRLWLLARALVAAPGDARRSYCIVGLRADEVFFNSWAERLGLRVDLYRHASSVEEEEYYPAAVDAGVTWKELITLNAPYLIRSSQDAETMFLAALLRDIRGEAVAVLIMRRAVPFFLMPQHTFFNFLWVILVLFLGFISLSIRLFGERVTRPLVDLRRAIRHITSSGNLGRRLEPVRRDEMGRLIEEFNAMLDKLESSSVRLNRSQQEMAAVYGDLLEQKRFTSEIVATASSIVLVFLPDGRVKFVNDAVVRIMGFRPEEMIGRPWIDSFVPYRHREEAHRILDGILKGTIEVFRQEEGYILTKEGQEKVILWSNSVITDEKNRVTSVLAIGMDITQWRQAEGDLRKKMSQLERFVRVTMDREEEIMELKRALRRAQGQAPNGGVGHVDH